ncbi:uncharacterized protein LOC120276959 [Dioscorea cayenensis subsp. rotundata]|uniref:Uncharacterized protein LOC120276959 n=1 Tax=Dioscorea cayennensis subsp. rotundata TaxID=55577 RepID=A0AB40CJA4_DIOCR|nr:uncharacterized protein LOC120276959 [Dioscorea cayenensis subsp. rotundata]
MKLARSRSRSSGFLCFGAPSSDDNDEHKPESSSRSSALITDEEQAPSRRFRRSQPRRSLTKVFRSAAFVSVLERIGSRRIGRGRSRFRKEMETLDDRSLTGSSSRSMDYDDQRTDSTDRIFLSSSLSSSSSSSSIVSSSAASLPPPPERKHRRRLPPSSNTRKPLPETENYHYATGLCLLVISFGVLLMFGRLCAIPWTATCLYFVPRRKYGISPPDAAVVMAALRSRSSEEDEKKRVVLEGLLERNHYKA